MGKNILIIALFCILLVSASLQNWYISTSYEELTGATRQIQEAINARDVQKVNSGIDEFGRIWDKNSDTWMSIMLHDQVDCVSKCYLLMKSYAKTGNLEQTSAYLSQVEYALSDVYKIDMLSIHNIL